MPQSYSSVYVHGIFATKDRQPLLAEHKERLKMHAYLAEVSKRLGCPAIIVNGTADHVHILAALGRTVTVADWMKELKRVSSIWSNEQTATRGFQWQGGYGSFSIGPERIDRTRSYIQNQEEHHRKVSYEEEFVKILEEHGLQLDPRFPWN